MSPPTKASFITHKGPDYLSSDLVRDDNYFSDWLNCQHRSDGSIQKRPGHKPVAPECGGCGLYKHRKRNQSTGVETSELITIGGGKLWRAVKLEMLITYTGAATEVLLNYWYDPTKSAYRMTIVAGITTLIDTDNDIGVGTDEAASFPIYPLDDLETLVDAHADLTCAITGSGASTTSAAFLFPHQYNYDLVDNPLTLYTYVWEEVNAPLTTLFNLAETAKDEDPNFELISATNWDALTYFANPYDGVMKYDGQTCYRAGVPQASIASLTEVAATGVAEITSIVCTADLTAPEKSRVSFIGTDPWQVSNGIKPYFILADSGGLVGVRFQQSGGTIDVPGTYRTIRVTYDNNDSPTDVAGKATTTIDADASFTCTQSFAAINITDVSNGERENISTTYTDHFIVATTQEGGTGLDGLYFVLGDAGGKRAFWYDVTGGVAEPAHGQPFATEITTVTAGMTSAQVATATEAVIEAEAGFTSTVSSATITATATPAGGREDGDSGTSPFSVSVTTQGANAGLGLGTFAYHATYEQRDAQGIFTEGDFSEDSSIVFAAATKNTSVVLPTIQDDTGYNTGCAIVNGAQAGVLTVTVDSGHTLEAGDQTYLKLASAVPVAQVETIACVADVASSLDGDYFFLHSRLSGTERATAFWIDVDNNGTSEPAHGAPDSQEITTITAGMTSTQVATAVAAVIHARSEWNATSSTNVVTVTHAVTGDVTDGYDGTTTFSFAVTTQGANQQVGEGVVKTVASVTATTITFADTPITVADNDVISNGLRIKLWRTELDGSSISKFLVDTLPNNSFAGTITYVDSVLDADLGEEWVEPEFTHGLPPLAKYATVWNKVLVLAGNPTSPSLVYYSIPFEFSPEYFPAEANSFPVYSNYGDQIRGLYALQDGVMVFKDRSYFPISGDIFTGQIRVDKRAQGDIQFLSHNSLIEAGNSLLFGDRKGLFSVDISSVPTEASEKLRPRIIDSMDLFDPRRLVGFYDRTQYRAMFLWPVLRRLDNEELVLDETLSFLTVYNALHQSWYIWDSIDVSGGITEFGEDIVFISWQENASDERIHQLSRLSREDDTPYAFQDHITAIDGYVKTSWYAGSSPSILKSFTFVKFYAEGDLTSVLQDVLVETERDLQENSVHTRFSWDSLTRKEQTFRLRPSKLKRMRFILSNGDANTNMLITGWELIGNESRGQSDLAD